MPTIKRNPRILYCVSEENYFRSHRLSLARYMKGQGYDVSVAMTCTTHCDDIKRQGIQVIPLMHFHRSSFHPWHGYRSFKELRSIIRHIDPHLVQNIGLKMSIVGSWAALGAPRSFIVNMLGGLGYVFTQSRSKDSRRSVLKIFVSAILRKLGKHPKIAFIVQNRADYQWVQQFSSQAFLVPGSGICLADFPATEFPKTQPREVVCLSRLLKDKGIREFAEAAGILKLRWGKKVSFVLYGDIDPVNPSSLTTKEILSWQQEGFLEWRGFCANVAKAYAGSYLVVLPSYREGLPKSLLEAASCGRAIVTTDVPGCRDVIEPGITGLLVPPYDGIALAEAIDSLLANPSLCASMGQAGRQRVQQHFSDEVIHTSMAKIYKYFLQKHLLTKK